MFVAFDENPIIVSKESQRNPGNLAMFGIKNAGRSASKDKLVIGGGVNQLISGRPAARLSDHNLVSGNDMVNLSRRTSLTGSKGLICSGFLEAEEKHPCAGHNRKVGTFGSDAALEVGFPVVVRVSQPLGGDMTGCGFSHFSRSEPGRWRRIGWVSRGNDRRRSRSNSIEGGSIRLASCQSRASPV